MTSVRVTVVLILASVVTLVIFGRTGAAYTDVRRRVLKMRLAGKGRRSGPVEDRIGWEIKAYGRSRTAGLSRRFDGMGFEMLP